MITFTQNVNVTQWNGGQVFRTCKTTHKSTICVGRTERMSRLPGNNNIDNMGYKLITCGSQHQVLFVKGGMKKNDDRHIQQQSFAVPLG